MLNGEYNEIMSLTLDSRDLQKLIHSKFSILSDRLLL